MLYCCGLTTLFGRAEANTAQGEGSVDVRGLLQIAKEHPHPMLVVTPVNNVIRRVSRNVFRTEKHQPSLPQVPLLEAQQSQQAL